MNLIVILGKLEDLILELEQEMDIEIQENGIIMDDSFIEEHDFYTSIYKLLKKGEKK